MRALTAVASFVLLSMVPVAQERRMVDMFVLTDKDAYLVTPPKLVTDGQIAHLDFSQDGKFAYIFGATEPVIDWKNVMNPSQSQGQPPKAFVRIWDLTTGAVRESSPAITALFNSSETASYSDEPLTWTAQSGVGIVTMSEFGERGALSMTTIKRVNFNDGSVTAIASYPPEGGFFDQILVSPKQQRVIHLHQAISNPIDKSDVRTTIAFRVIDLTGRQLKTGRAELKGRAHLSEWTLDGKNLVGYSAVPGPPGKKPVVKTIVLNSDTGVISETMEEIKVYGATPVEAPLKPVISDMPVQLRSDKAVTQSLWLSTETKSEDPQCLVANGVDGPNWLSPGLTHIAYMAQGRLFASEIVKVDLQTYLKAKEAAERAIAMSNTKQVALGLLIYSADSDDFLPPQAGYQDALYPYMKNRDIMNGFVFTYSGGSLSKLDNPAETELGYVSVSGGRCVAYADGHVKFIKG